MSTLIVDGANVVGARPDGWWKDRAGAAARLHEQLLVADIEYDVVVLVLEGQAKGGVRAGRDAHVRTVHAPKDGDATILAEARRAAEKGGRVVVVTATGPWTPGCTAWVPRRSPRPGCCPNSDPLRGHRSPGRRW